MRKEFVVHPARADYLKFAAEKLNLSTSVQVCERNVMRGATKSVGFLTHTVFAVNDWWLGRLQDEMEGKTVIDGLQDLLIAAPCYLPIAVPDAVLLLAYSGNSRTGAIHAFCMMKVSTVQIAQR